MIRYFFEIAYRGTNYHGWQRQDNAISVQQVVEEVLSKLWQSEVVITGSGRTDTGVHCEQQYFHVDTEVPLEASLLETLNKMLPKDILIRSMHKVGDEKHARFDASSRKYEYRIGFEKDPFAEDLYYFLRRDLNYKTMNEAAALLLGQHDFESFSKVKTQVNNFICEISEAEWKVERNQLIFHIRGNRFLRGMVRAVVGTLLEVGTGKQNVRFVAEVLAARDRRAAGPAAPAHGLFLTEVNYPFIDK